MLSAFDITDVILRISDPEIGDEITNLKLQKLLYYCQGFHLALYNEKLFEEDVYAWQYGPVVKEVYHKYKDNGAEILMPSKEFDIKLLKEKQGELIEEVYEVYGQFSALKLMNMTHREPPWANTTIGEKISEKLMQDYFKTLLLKDGE